MNASARVLGRLMVAAGAVGEQELAAALEEQRSTRERLGEILVRRGVDPEAVAQALAAQLRLPYVERPLTPEPSALALVDQSLALRSRVLPLAVRERRVQVAMADPLDAAAVDDLQFQTGRRVEPMVAVPGAVDEGLAAAYGADAVQALLTRLPGSLRTAVQQEAAADVDEVSALRRASEAPPIVALVDLVLGRAVAARASDVHVEPAGESLRVRARVDGVLRELLALPEHAAAAVVSRIKIMAGLDIAVKRRPQDGRCAVRVDDRELGLRVSTLPSAGREKVVLRLLDSGNAGRSLDELDLAAPARARLERLLGRGHGVLLVTGPTGSGKTTMLYAALGTLDRDRKNIVTLEDPIEYQLAGLTQVQVHEQAGLTFATALRAVLRQDPDVIMIGEMRDRETVEIGMAAALTGHLVLSTLHTNDAAGAVARLVEMGAAPYLIAGGLIGVLAQRLARRLCKHCRAPYDADAEELRELGLPARPVRLHAARGCKRCDGDGYRGRIGIFELLRVDARIRELLLRGADAGAVRAAARTGGMEPLGHDAWQKICAGLTTIDEVRPLLTLIADEAPVCPGCGGAIRREFVACPACGHPLRHRCRCGAVFDQGWRFCAACGSPRDQAAPGNPAAAPGVPL